MTYSDRLFRWRDPYDLAGTESLFAAALAESAQRQAAGCPDYARILKESTKPGAGSLSKSTR